MEFSKEAASLPIPLKSTIFQCQQTMRFAKAYYQTISFEDASLFNDFQCEILVLAVQAYIWLKKNQTMRNN